MRMIFYEYWVINNSGLFDPVYYLLNNPDVRIADIDPLFHYVRNGWKEGRNPSKDFDGNYYLATYADVKSSGINPLIHYVRFGKAEGRFPLPGKDYRKISTPFRRQNAQIKNRLSIKTFRLAQSFIRIYGFRNFIKKVINKLFPKTNVQSISSEKPLRIFRDKFSSPIHFEKEILPVDAKISVVVPTKNAGNEFDFLMKMLKQQGGIREIELVIVDSGSTDGTILIAKRHGAKIVQIKPENFSHSYARNLGAENATGDYLLFMVQDALPSSKTWLYELFTLLKDNNVSAVSCAESPREDADLFYRVLSWNHYKFLEVNNGDRIFQYPVAQDNISLRKNGQLSDLACLIAKDTFAEYKYRGDYGEDLDLGLRLIKDGKMIAYSGEICVIHSHNRSAYYFLKRGYVDNLFLSDKFSDFAIPRISQEDLFADIAFTYEFLSHLTQIDMGSINYPIGITSFEDLIVKAIENCREQNFPSKIHHQVTDYKDQQFVAFVEDLLEKAGLRKRGQKYNGILIPEMFQHVNNLFDYLNTVHKYIDDDLAEEIKTFLFKQLGIMIGSHLAFCYVKRTGKELINLENLHTILKEGI